MYSPRPNVSCPLSPALSAAPLAIPSSRSHLDQLPSELIGAIAEFLPASSRIALKLCSHALLHKTPLQRDFRPEDCSVCEKNVLRRYRSEYKRLREARRYCLVCHTLQDAKYMCYGGGRICSFHGGMFIHPANFYSIGDSAAGSSERSGHDAQWVWFWRQLCVHKGQVRWATRGQPCECGCEFCGHIDVACRSRTQTRAGSWRSGEIGIAKSCTSLLEMQVRLLDQ
nr:hypothetical protein CFP56_24545 [Quercus suber]